MTKILDLSKQILVLPYADWERKDGSNISSLFHHFYELDKDQQNASNIIERAVEGKPTLLRAMPVVYLQEQHALLDESE